MRHVNQRPSLAENNSLIWTFVSVWSGKSEIPKSIWMSLRGFQKYLHYHCPQVEEERMAAVGRGKVEYWRRSHDVNRWRRWFNKLALPNYEALRSSFAVGSLEAFQLYLGAKTTWCGGGYLPASESRSLPALMSMSATSWPFTVSLLRLWKQWTLQMKHSIRIADFH